MKNQALVKVFIACNAIRYIAIVEPVIYLLALTQGTITS